MYSMVSTVNYAVLSICKLLREWITRKNCNCVVMAGDHFTIYTNTESLCHNPETYTIC